MNLAGGVVPKKIKNMCLRTYLVWVLPFLVPSKKNYKNVCRPTSFHVEACLIEDLQIWAADD